VGLAEAAAGDPVGGITVTLSGTGGSFTTTTSTDGNFVFPNVPPGSYTVQVVDTAPEPDVSYTVNLTVDGAPATTIDVGAGDSATISGRVTETAVLLTVQVDATDVGDLLQNSAQLCHAISIATASGKNLQDVINARLASGKGHGWGKLARQFGAPPSVLGNNSCTESQIADASALAGGRGHGNGNGNGNGKGKGKGKGQS
jgi:hypothetical protein